VKKGSDDEKTLARDTAAAASPRCSRCWRSTSALQLARPASAGGSDEDPRGRPAARRLQSGIEQQLFDIRLESLSAFDQYIAKTQEADRLIAESQKAAALGTEEGPRARSSSPPRPSRSRASSATVTDQNGVKIVTTLQAQTTKTGILRKRAGGGKPRARQPEEGRDRQPGREQEGHR
jgi:hypothetical protein